MKIIVRNNSQTRIETNDGKDLLKILAEYKVYIQQIDVHIGPKEVGIILTLLDDELTLDVPNGLCKVVSNPV